MKTCTILCVESLQVVLSGLRSLSFVSVSGNTITTDAATPFDISVLPTEFGCLVAVVGVVGDREMQAIGKALPIHSQTQLKQEAATIGRSIKNSNPSVQVAVVG